MPIQFRCPSCDKLFFGDSRQPGADRLCPACSVPEPVDAWWVNASAPAPTPTTEAPGSDITRNIPPAPPGGVNVWAIADDEVVLVAYAPIPGGPATTPVDLGRLGAGLRQAGLGATDVSSGWAVLRLVGVVLTT